MNDPDTGYIQIPRNHMTQEDLEPYKNEIFVWTDEYYWHILDLNFVRRNPNQYLTHQQEKVRDFAKTLLPIKKEYDYYHEKIMRLGKYFLSRIYSPLVIFSVIFSLLIAFFIKPKLGSNTILLLTCCTSLLVVLNLLRLRRFDRERERLFNEIFSIRPKETE